MVVTPTEHRNRWIEYFGTNLGAAAVTSAGLGYCFNYLWYGTYSYNWHYPTWFGDVANWMSPQAWNITQHAAAPIMLGAFAFSAARLFGCSMKTSAVIGGSTFAAAALAVWLTPLAPTLFAAAIILPLVLPVINLAKAAMDARTNNSPRSRTFGQPFDQPA